MKNITILGSTGSIGQQAIEVIKNHRKDFNVIGLSTNTNTEVLIAQTEDLKPEKIAVFDSEKYRAIKGDVPEWVKLLEGMEGLKKLASYDRNDIVLNALVGAVGLEATMEALESVKVLALANKESMVVGGELINETRKRTECQIIPVDSEHSAIFQCLMGEKKKNVKKVILTGSGGPFRGKEFKDFKEATVEEALAHPRWSMGKKISIDSATMMNKGLEVIEAHYLFEVGYDDIEVVIHPQSIVHSMILFDDGSLKAQLGPTDMKIPIQFSLTYPERIESFVPEIGMSGLKIDFEEPDWVNFPCLRLAYEAGRESRTYPTVLNASNEEAVRAFLNRRIGFGKIPYIIEKTINSHKPFKINDLNDILEADRWSREVAKRYIKGGSG